MTEDLIKRLRFGDGSSWDAGSQTAREAADLIERLYDEVEGLKRKEEGEDRALPPSSAALAPSGLSPCGSQAEPPAANAWQPIETAPKDGTPILITNTVRGGSWVAQYSERYASGMNRENPWFSLMLNTRWHLNPYASMIPTHWMPLPTPPEAA